MISNPPENDMIYLYYAIGNHPIRIAYNAARTAVKAETIDPKTQIFQIQNALIGVVAKNPDARPIDQKTFVNLCLQHGVKAP